LGHVSGARSGVIGVYNKSDRKARVREAVERLEAHIAAILARPSLADNVIRLNAGAQP
jgi:hypothetical protein